MEVYIYNILIDLLKSDLLNLIVNFRPSNDPVINREDDNVLILKPG